MIEERSAKSFFQLKARMEAEAAALVHRMETLAMIDEASVSPAGATDLSPSSSAEPLASSMDLPEDDPMPHTADSRLYGEIEDAIFVQEDDAVDEGTRSRFMSNKLRPLGNATTGRQQVRRIQST